MPTDLEAPALVLGPLLRHVDPVSATVWVETDRACVVEVLGRRARTFCVGGHHYALVVVEDLEPGSTTPYEVRLDDALVWPPQRSAFPPSRIRTPGEPGEFRVAFGSCRYATPGTAEGSRSGASSYRRPLMKNVGVDSTWLCQPETSWARTAWRWRRRPSRGSDWDRRSSARSSRSAC